MQGNDFVTPTGAEGSIEKRTAGLPDVPHIAGLSLSGHEPLKPGVGSDVLLTGGPSKGNRDGSPP